MHYQVSVDKIMIYRYATAFRRPHQRRTTMVNIKAFRTTVYILVLLNLSEKFAQLGETFTVKNMPPPRMKSSFMRIIWEGVQIENGKRK